MFLLSAEFLVSHPDPKAYGAWAGSYDYRSFSLRPSPFWATGTVGTELGIRQRSSILVIPGEEIRGGRCLWVLEEDGGHVGTHQVCPGVESVTLIKCVCMRVCKHVCVVCIRGGGGRVTCCSPLHHCALFMLNLPNRL